MSDTAIVASFHRLLQDFSPCFTAPSFTSFLTLMSGWPLNLRRHTITETVRAAGAVGLKDITSFHRFFSRARWVPDALGLVVVRLIVEHLLSADGPVVAVVDAETRVHGVAALRVVDSSIMPSMSAGRPSRLPMTLMRTPWACNSATSRRT